MARHAFGVLCIVAFLAILLGAVLLAGCRAEATTPPLQEVNDGSNAETR